MIFDATGERVGIRRPTLADCDEFVALMEKSREFHLPWGDFPNNRERFCKYLETRKSGNHDGFLICQRDTQAIMGVINVNEIVRGAFQSAYLGYYIGACFARQGFTSEGIKLVTRYAFDVMKLHRLEANIQPLNVASIALVRKCGFRKEGFSPRYLHIQGQWRDHERWAILADE
jgi:[ribosomal protein S5]-alanine N-acetyltransferase